jgi:hypothetical protein
MSNNTEKWFFITSFLIVLDFPIKCSIFFFHEKVPPKCDVEKAQERGPSAYSEGELSVANAYGGLSVHVSGR